ncbi:hypothetical protein DL767_000994 [Monosporascus sp. MG133]|nr:hypothetical protein DL767_000994 [Monosporascus sp. MG133]
MTFLYLVPIISSTCSLYFAWDQWFFMRIFLKKDIRAPADRLLTSYWQTFCPPAVTVVLSLISVTSATSFGLVYTSSTLLREKGSYNWFLAGGTLAIGHLVFAPAMMPILQDLQDSNKDNPTKTLRNWVRVHGYRAATVDLACWICCLVATVKTIDA